MKRVSMLPSLLTLGNFVCGFIAIIFCAQAIYKQGVGDANSIIASDQLFMYACYSILFGMIFDVLDGRVARMTGATSHFGAELDSLADCCTFGMGPAIVVATWWIKVQPDSAKWWSYVMGCGIVYAACAVIRLARYNVEAEEGNKNYFAGLPSPGAAGAVITTVLITRYENISNLLERAYEAVVGTVGITSNPQVHGLYILGTYMLLIGLMMISRYRFVHVANRFFTGRKKLTWLVAAIFVAMFLWQYPREMFFVGFNGYVLASLASNLKHDYDEDAADKDEGE